MDRLVASEAATQGVAIPELMVEEHEAPFQRAREEKGEVSQQEWQIGGRPVEAAA